MDEQAYPHRPERQGGIATAEEGQVMLDGPDGVAVSMTPEAAETTARSLLDAAELAVSQRNAGTRPD